MLTPLSSNQQRPKTAAESNPRPYMLPRFVSQLSLLVDSERLPSSSKHWYTAPGVPLIRPHPYLLPLIPQQTGVRCNGTLRCLSASRAWPANHSIHFDCHAFDLLRQVQGSQLESSSRELCPHQHSRGYRGVGCCVRLDTTVESSSGR